MSGFYRPGQHVLMLRASPEATRGTSQLRRVVMIDGLSQRFEL